MKHIGQILLDSGKLSEDDLSEARKIALNEGTRLEEALMHENKISEKDFLEVVSHHFGLQYLSNIPENNVFFLTKK